MVTIIYFLNMSLRISVLWQSPCRNIAHMENDEDLDVFCYNSVGEAI